MQFGRNDYIWKQAANEARVNTACSVFKAIIVISGGDRIVESNTVRTGI